MDEQWEATALRLLRRQRHSFLNHLQVISGWLQLERPDRARQYLEAVAARVAAESDAVRRLPPVLALVVTELGQEAETYGVEVDWHVGENAADMLSEQANELQKAVSEAVRSAGARCEGERKVAVVLDRTAFTVHTPPAKGEG